MGTMNFGLYPMLARQKEFKYDWEKPYLEGSRERMFKNTFADIEYILTTCANNGTRFEIECYDIGHLYTLRHFADRGVVKPPFFIQSVFGILGGIGPHPEDVLHMKRTADRLFGDEYHWSVLGAGRNQMADRGAGRGHGRQRARRHGGLALDRPRPARQEQRRAGDQGAPDHRGPGARDRHAATRRARCSSSRAATRWGSSPAVVPRRDRGRNCTKRTDLQIAGGNDAKRCEATEPDPAAKIDTDCIWPWVPDTRCARSGMTGGLTTPDPPARRSSRAPRSGCAGIRRRAA